MKPLAASDLPVGVPQAIGDDRFRCWADTCDNYATTDVGLCRHHHEELAIPDAIV